jgi:hypothetical protein
MCRFMSVESRIPHYLSTGTSTLILILDWQPSCLSEGPAEPGRRQPLCDAAPALATAPAQAAKTFGDPDRDHREASYTEGVPPHRTEQLTE